MCYKGCITSRGNWNFPSPKPISLKPSNLELLITAKTAEYFWQFLFDKESTLKFNFKLSILLCLNILVGYAGIEPTTTKVNLLLFLASAYTIPERKK